MTQSGKMNFGPEDQQRQVSGGALIALTVGAMVFSESARGSYGTCAVALSAGLVQWRTGERHASPSLHTRESAVPAAVSVFFR